MKKYKNILLPLDFSEYSDSVFYLGCLIANNENATLHLIHIIESGYRSETMKDEFLHEMRSNNAMEEINKFILEIPHLNINIKSAIRFGKPDDEIIKYAKENNIDLVILNNYSWNNEEYPIMLKKLKQNLCSEVIPAIFFSENKSHFFSQMTIVNRNHIGTNTEQLLYM